MSTPGCASGCRLAVARFALGRAGRQFGDGGAGHPLGGSEVGPGARRCWDGDREVLLQAAVAGWVVWGAVLPAAPHDPAPGAADGAQSAGVVVAAGASGDVAVGGPRVPVPGGVREPAERTAQPLVAAPAEACGFAFAGLDRDRGLAGVASERVTGRVARTTVADLGQQLGSGEHAVGVAEQREEDVAVRMGAQRGRDLLGRAA